MKKHFVKILGAILISNSLMAQLAPIKSIEGRWDITITKGDKKVPSWLEVNHSGVKYLNGHFVGDGGSAILTFDTPIANGPGFDFAVFENGFSDTFLEKDSAMRIVSSEKL